MATSDPSMSANPAPSALPAQQPVGAAFERVKPELEALAAEDLVRITVDLAKAGTNATGVVPRIMAHREAIVRELPSFDISKVDKLSDYAAAMFYADAGAAPPKLDPAAQKLLDEGTELRARMLAVAGGLAHVGLFDEEQLAHVRKGTGHIDLAKDLVSLSKAYRDSWQSLEGKCPITHAEIERAGVVGNSIRESVGGKNIRNQVGERNASSADAEMRARAYTLFINAYEECRAAVGFIRRKHGDAESIAPTVFHRVRRRGAKVEEAETVPDTVGSGAPAPAAPEAATD